MDTWMGYKVLKFPLDPLKDKRKDGYIFVDAPFDAKVVLVDQQRGVPTVWLEVATKDPPEHRQRRSFKVYATGEPVSDYDIHRGSYIDGAFVWHVYESNP